MRRLLSATRSSLAVRLTLWYALATFVLVAAVAWAQYRSLAADLAGEDDQLLLETLAVARTEPLPALHIAPSAASGPLLRVIDGACRVVGGAVLPAGPPPRCDIPNGSPNATPALRTWVGPDGSLWRVAAQRLSSAVTSTRDGAGSARIIEVVLNRWTDKDVLRRYRRELSVLLPAAFLVAAALGLLLARRGLAPLRALADSVGEIDVRSLDRPVVVANAPDEVQALVASFEMTRRRLQEAFDALTQFSAELAHEFRTPLHVLRQQAEVALAQGRTPEAYREVLRSSLEELDQLRRMVDDILFLARTEDPRAHVAPGSLIVATELGDVAEFLEALARDRDAHLVINAPPELRVIAERTLLRRALVNLVTNAIRHMPDGGVVTLSAHEEPGDVVIEVQDTGPGVPAHALPRVFDRYFRLPGTATEARDGTGLGLAIVRGIMSLHGGTAEMSSVVGRGTCVTLRFPVPATPGSPAV